MESVSGPQLHFEPADGLHFKKIVIATIQLTNPTDKKIVFRVLPTANKQYSITPANGKIDPQKSISVAVFVNDGEISDGTTHKFKVQSMFAPEHMDNPTNLWADVSPENIRTSKLKCWLQNPDTNQGALSYVDEALLRNMMSDQNNRDFEDKCLELDQKRAQIVELSAKIEKLQLALQTLQEQNAYLHYELAVVYSRQKTRDLKSSQDSHSETVQTNPWQDKTDEEVFPSSHAEWDLFQRNAFDHLKVFFRDMKNTYSEMAQSVQKIFDFEERKPQDYIKGVRLHVEAAEERRMAIQKVSADKVFLNLRAYFDYRTSI